VKLKLASTLLLAVPALALAAPAVNLAATAQTSGVNAGAKNTASNAGASVPQVSLMPTPDGGIQPQALMDAKGVLHLIYFKGSPDAGDVYYVRLRPGAAGFSKPVRVNSFAGSVIAVGSVRGAQMALGADGRVHVAWLGSAKAQPRGPGNSTPMLYTRSNRAGTAFEPQRNVMQFATGLDGGGSVAADRFGDVYVAWHANPKSDGEAHRQVWIARSTDNGKTFAREKAAFRDPTGACGCCGMRIFAGRNGSVYVLYRAATEGIHRDMTLLVSTNRGKTFAGKIVNHWQLNACPMSTDFVSEAAGRVLLAWEKAEQVYYAALQPGAGTPERVIAAPGQGQDRKHPVVVANKNGDVLLAWTVGTAWQRGGGLAWQVFNAAGQPLGAQGFKPGVVPIWGLVAAVARRDGGFTLIY
jgi:hypothetical protein